MLSDGTFPIALRLIKGRKKKIISFGMSCHKGEFESQEFKKTARNYKKRNQIILKLKAKAYEVIEDFQLKEVDYTLEEFENKFRGIDTEEVVNVFDFFDKIIDENIRSGKIGNARAYQETKQSLLGFNSNLMKFSDVTLDFLEKYEVFLREKGNRDGGIAFKMRQFRALYNKAINRGYVGQELYPFKNYKISKLKERKNKRALTIEEFKRIKELDLTKHPHLVNSYNFFMFSFYTRGMNFVDMMHLKWSNINGDTIEYTRSKTKGNFKIKILPITKEILTYYKSQNRPTDYVFPIILKNGLSPSQLAHRKKKVLSRFNFRLKELAELAGIKKTLTSYVARHSYATILKKKGVSTDMISESMGHSDLRVTNTYLKEFENETIDKANDKLLEL